MHTRKLLEIALEMLFKSQVPSVQFIALTTINRIFDIYVYHNLFYPGYYESCYIPLSKRIQTKHQQQTIQSQNILQIAVNQEQQLHHKQQEEATHVSNNLKLNKRALKNKSQQCNCQVPTFKKQTSINSPNLVKETDLALNEERPEELNNLIEYKSPNRTTLAKTKASNPSFSRSFANRLTGFLRRFSLVGSNSSNSSSQSSQTQLCSNCNKYIVLSPTSDKRLSKYPIPEGIDEENPDELAKDEKDYATSLLIGEAANLSISFTNAGEKTVKEEKTRIDSEVDYEKDDEVDSNSNNNYNFYLNQPFKYLANSIEPKSLLLIIQERLESHKKVDINASTMGNSSTPLTNSNPNTTVNSRVKCMPSARTVNCQHHCVAVLATRIFACLCNEQAFQQKLVTENQEICFNIIIEVLYPNNDPVNYFYPRICK